MGGSPTLSSLFAQRVVIGVGDMAVSSSPNVTLSTYALGSCVGAIIYDPVTFAGGMIHIMLPNSKLSPEKAALKPYIFADTGMKAFFDALKGIGVDKFRARIAIAGGASVLEQKDIFKIGENNAIAIKGILSKEHLPIFYEELGGLNNRTLHLVLSTGELEIKQPTTTKKILLK